jgi:hypothetical protein
MNELQLGDFFVFLSIILHTRRLMFVTHTYSKNLGVLHAFPTLKELQNSAPVLLTNRTCPKMSSSLIARIRCSISLKVHMVIVRGRRHMAVAKFIAF